MPLPFPSQRRIQVRRQATDREVRPSDFLHPRKPKLVTRIKMNAVLGILRHILTAAGGGLVTSGTITDGDLQTGIGAVATLVGLIWSILEKRNRKP